jgi:hypothetical protein
MAIPGNMNTRVDDLDPVSGQGQFPSDNGAGKPSANNHYALAHVPGPSL